LIRATSKIKKKKTKFGGVGKACAASQKPDLDLLISGGSGENGCFGCIFLASTIRTTRRAMREDAAFID
jgi:hypothetical protein